MTEVGDVAPNITVYHDRSRCCRTINKVPVLISCIISLGCFVTSALFIFLSILRCQRRYRYTSIRSTDISVVTILRSLSGNLRLINSVSLDIGLPSQLYRLPIKIFGLLSVLFSPFTHESGSDKQNKFSHRLTLLLIY